MSNKDNMVHIRLDDEQKKALDKITAYHRSRTLGESSISSVIRALIVTEHRRLFPGEAE